MGNRAVILNKKELRKNGTINPNQIGIYLHWNGGRDSVEAFLKYCELQGYRTPDTDCYGWAYLCTVIGNFFGDGLSLGIDTAKHLDITNGDNGVYLIEGWKIVGRKNFNREEQHYYPIDEYLMDIDSKMPVNMQLKTKEENEKKWRAMA